MARFSNPQNFKGQGLISKQDLGLSAETDVLVSGSKIVSEYMPTLKFQGNEVGNFANSINIIGIGNVTVDDSGNITLRLGENLNCSEFNTTDGISNATINYAANGVESLTALSPDLSKITNVFKDNTDSVTIKGGTVATTDTVAGNSIHLITSGDIPNVPNQILEFLYYKGTTDTDMSSSLISFEINGAKTTTLSGITCAITNMKAEPNTIKGATGYCANINFTMSPATMFGTTAGTFKFKSVALYDKDDENRTLLGKFELSTPTNYYWLVDTTKPGTPSGVTYTISSQTKKICGVTYLTTDSRVVTKITDGITNLGYPAYATTKLTVAGANSNNWFTSYEQESTTAFTNWNQSKDEKITYTSNAKPLNKGVWTNPEVTMYGTNYRGEGSTASSNVASGTLLVCDTNGIVNTSNDGSLTLTNVFTNGACTTNYTTLNETNLINTSNLQWYNKTLIYPSTDYTEYNTQTVFGEQTNYDYSTCTGTRTAYMKLGSGGTAPINNGNLTIDTNSKLSDEILSGGIASGLIEFCVSKTGEEDSWIKILSGAPDLSCNKVTYNTTNTVFNFSFDSTPPLGYLYLRIQMKKGCTVAISDAELEIL